MVRSMSRARAVVWITCSCLAVAGCSKKKEGAEGDGSAAGSAAPVAPGASGAAVDPSAKELAFEPATAGLTWKRVEMPFGSLELPTNPGWVLLGTDVHGEDDLVIMLQSQDGISPDQQGSYLKQYGKLQARDAHGYRAKAHAGTLRGDPAIRIEGTFDNGTKYVTREYLVFANGKVVALSAHIPAINAAKLPGVIDHLARTLTVK